MPEPDLEAAWKRLGARRPETGPCSQCGKVEHADGSLVRWRCQVCHQFVCRSCTLTLPQLPQLQNHPGPLAEPSKPEVAGNLVLRGGREYLEQTLCSRVCWEAAGKPDE